MVWRVVFTLLLFAGGDPRARVVSLRPTVDEESLKASLHVVNAFGPEVVERIESGLPTSFLYRFELFRERRRWWDDEIGKARLEVVVMYNAVTREYLVNFKLDGKLVESHLAHGAGELEAAMTRIDRCALFALDELPRDSPLRLKARVRTGSRTFLAFIPIDVETDWTWSEPFRLPSSD